MAKGIQMFLSIGDVLEFLTQANNLNDHLLMAVYVFWIYFDVFS